MKKYIIVIIWVVKGFNSGAQGMETLRKDMFGIASVETEGRFTASPGYRKAARYVVNQLKAAGIKPGWVEKNKPTYFQPVPFTWDDYSGSLLSIKGQPFPLHHDAKNFIVTQRGMAKVGKWVVIKPGDSVKGEPAGIILLPTQGQAGDWETTVIRQYRFGYMHYQPDGVNEPQGVSTILVSPTVAKMLVPGDSLTVVLKYRAEAKTGCNVIGVVPGRSRLLASQAIVVSAHLDHIGRIGNHIYNGANDDASGCVAELGAAKILATRPEKRSFIFVFFCGEELNLKGSRWFVDHLPVSRRNIMMSVNLEQVGSKHRSFKGIWALGDTSTKAAFYRAGNNFKTPDLHFSAMDSVVDILSNTDTYNFMNKHITSLLLGSGGFDEHHTPRDNIDLIDFDHLKKATHLLYNFLSFVGDYESMP